MKMSCIARSAEQVNEPLATHPAGPDDRDFKMCSLLSPAQNVSNSFEVAEHVK